MKTAKKAILLVLCAALLVTASVMGTLAYLTSKTETITNTMSVGNVKITMDEAKVDKYGVKDGETRVMVNNYKLIPGHTYIKDPIIHVAQGSEACYLFVKISNGIAGFEKAGVTTIAKQMEANGWRPLVGETGVYYMGVSIDAREEAQNVSIFTSFTIDANAEKIANWSAGGTIEIIAYAVQADGFASAQAAWDAAKGYINPPVGG